MHGDDRRRLEASSEARALSRGQKNYFDVRVVLLDNTLIIEPTASWFNPPSLS